MIQKTHDEAGAPLGEQWFLSKRSVDVDAPKQFSLHPHDWQCFDYYPHAFKVLNHFMEGEKGVFEIRQKFIDL